MEGKFFFLLGVSCIDQSCSTENSYIFFIFHHSSQFILHDLYRFFASFLWNFNEESRNKHWVSWYEISLSKEAGVLGFRSLFDVLKALNAKLWWTFRTKKFCWLILSRTRIVKGRVFRCWNWEEEHKYGSTYWKPQTTLINKSDENLSVGILVFGLIIGPSLELYISISYWIILVITHLMW